MFLEESVTHIVMVEQELELLQLSQEWQMVRARCQQDWRCCWTCPMFLGKLKSSMLGTVSFICANLVLLHHFNFFIAGEDRSLNIFVKEEDKLTFHRHPVAQSTDCIRSKASLYLN